MNYVIVKALSPSTPILKRINNFCSFIKHSFHCITIRHPIFSFLCSIVIDIFCTFKSRAQCLCSKVICLPRFDVIPFVWHVTTEKKKRVMKEEALFHFVSIFFLFLFPSLRFLIRERKNFHMSAISVLLHYFPIFPSLLFLLSISCRVVSTFNWSLSQGGKSKMAC